MAKKLTNSARTRQAALFATAAAGALAVLAAGSAQAAEGAPPGAAAGAAAPQQGGLQEVIVTARKRAESAQNIPVAVVAVSAEELAKRNIQKVEDVAQITPQFVIARGSSGSGANLSLRGIGSNFTSIGIEQSVSVNVDGIYFGQGRILNEGMFDMSEVELLKGPQALFFGKNATAGVLSFTSANPGSVREAMARAGYEFTTHDKQFEGYLSGPLTDKLSARLALRLTRMDEGYMQNQMGGLPITVTDTATGVKTVYAVPPSARFGPQEKNTNVRGTVKYQPNDDLTVVLKTSHSEHTSTTPGFLNELFRCPVGGTSQLSPGDECNKDWKGYWGDLPAALVSGNSLLGKKGGGLYDQYTSNTYTSNVNYNLGHAVISWVTGYERFADKFALKSDATDNTNRGTYAGTSTGYNAFSTELRAQTYTDLPVNGMVGLYYQNSKLRFLQDILFPGSAAGGHLINSAAGDPNLVPLTVRKLGHTDGETLAAFAQVLWDVTHDLQFTAGGRATRETKDSDFQQPYVHPGFRAAFTMFNPANPAATSFTRGQVFKNFSPEATLTWKPNTDLTVYGAFKTGYKSGGFSISGLLTPKTSIKDMSFEPETVKGWEGGIRSRLLDNHLRLNVTAFRYDYKNLQVDFFNSTITTFVTFNAGTARTQGVEFDGDWNPDFAPDLLFHATVAYDDAKYVKFPGAPCYAGETLAQGCLPATPAINYAHQDLAGVATQLAPKWTGSLSVDYTHDLPGGMKVGATADARFSGSYLLSPFGNPVDLQEGYANFDLSVRLGPQNDRWQVAVIAKNLTNRYVLTAAQDAPSTGAAGVPADQYGFPAPPRTVLLQFTAKY